MKTKEELLDDYMEHLNFLGEDFSPLEVRRGFLAGYRVAMDELSKLPLNRAVTVILYESMQD